MKTNTKIISTIEHITLDAATFHNVAITPTLINFIYGNNGTGKSTIAREINADRGLAWQDGKSAVDYSVLIYNQEFVEANFRNYGNCNISISYSLFFYCNQLIQWK